MPGRPEPVQSRQIGKHKQGCFALANFQRGFWFTPWALPLRPDPLVSATIKGNPDPSVSRRNHLFVQYICNDPSCTARLLVANDAILRMVNRERG